MRIQLTLPDGNCLFRSAAVSLLRIFTGKNCGKGALFGKESTLAHAIHNTLALWLRVLVVYNLAGEDATIETAWDGRSLLMVLAKVHRLTENRNMRTKFKTPRAAREFMRRLRPKPPRLCIAGRGQKVYPEGMTADELTLAGRYDGETFSHYLRRLLRHGTWGGATECYVLSQVLLLPVFVVQRGLSPQRYLPKGRDEVAHRIIVRFDGDNHYDAVLESKEVVPVFLL